MLAKMAEVIFLCKVLVNAMLRLGDMRTDNKHVDKWWLTLHRIGAKNVDRSRYQSNKLIEPQTSPN